MTGRDLIIYIIENHLEDQPIYENGNILGFMSIYEAAVKFEVGIGTIIAWVQNSSLDGVKVGNDWYIPVNAKNPCEGGLDV